MSSSTRGTGAGAACTIKRLSWIVLVVLAVPIVGCEAELTTRELRLDARNLLVAITNDTDRPYTLSYTGAGLFGSRLLPPFSRIQEHFEPDADPRPEWGLPRDDWAWVLRLGEAVVTADGQWIGSRGPTTFVARGDEPLRQATAEVHVFITDGGIRWRLAGVH